MPDTKPKANYTPLFAVLGVILVAAILLSPADAFTSRGITFIDTELKSTGNPSQQFVRTKYPMDGPKQLTEFPKSLGKWNMSHQYEWDAIAELLNTDVLLVRDYRQPGVYVPVSLLIIQSKNVSSFHPAPICYRGLGYTILDNFTATVDVPVADDSWKESEWLQTSEEDGTPEIQAKKLLVERPTGNGARQRELNLYFYAKEEHRNVANQITWVRVSMFVPTSGPYDGHEAILRSFISEVVPELLDPDAESRSGTLLGRLLSKAGVGSDTARQEW